MLRPEGMKKVLIVGPDTYLKKVINGLYKLGVLHIVEHKGTKELDIGSPLKQAERLSETIVTIRGIANYLNIDLKKELKAEKLKNEKRLKFAEVNKNVNAINERVSKIQERLSAIDNSLKEKHQILNELIPLKKINVSFGSFAEYKTLISYVGKLIKPKGFIEELKNITTKFEIISKEEDNKLYFALFADKSFANPISSLLQGHGFEPVNISKYKDERRSPSQILDKVNIEISKLNEEQKSLSDELNKIKSKWEDYLITAERFLNEEIEKAQAPLKFAKTAETFMITGWLPEKKLEKATQRLSRITNNNIYIETLPIAPHEHVPIQLTHPKLVKPFEFFMNLYSLPSHHELDPTFFVFLTFPIFFGFMLGDMGYGLVTLISFILLKKKFSKMASFFDILILASLSTIIFGAIFGEFFGAEEILGFHIPRLISRNPEHHLEPLMIAAVFFGIVHVNVGLIIGFVNEFHEYGLKKAILAKSSWLALEVGVLLLALSLLKILNISWLIGAIALLISVVMLFLGEGPRGIVEIPGLFGNILSYLRLMAIGLSSVGLAIVINTLAGKFFEHFSVFSIFGIIILIIGHALNIGIGILGGFLHSLRLHYVEFFTKFYKGGGIPYLPFGERAKT